MGLSINKIDTRYIDCIINALETIYEFKYITAPGVTTVDPASLIELQTQIIELRALKKEWISDFNSSIAHLNKNLDKINS